MNLMITFTVRVIHMLRVTFTTSIRLNQLLTDFLKVGDNIEFVDEKNMDAWEFLNYTLGK